MLGGGWPLVFGVFFIFIFGFWVVLRLALLGKRKHIPQRLCLASGVKARTLVRLVHVDL